MGSNPETALGQVGGPGGPGGPMPSDPSDLETAPPLNADLCAFEYMGEANGVHYYTTCNCVNGFPAAPFGFGQSDTPCVAGTLGCGVGSSCGCQVQTISRTPMRKTAAVSKSQIHAARDRLVNLMQNSLSKAKRTAAWKLYDDVDDYVDRYEALTRLNDTAGAAALEVEFVGKWDRHARYLSLAIVETGFPVGGSGPGTKRMVSIPDRKLTGFVAPSADSFVLTPNTGFRMSVEQIVSVPRSSGTPVYFQLFEVRRQVGAQRLYYGQEITPPADLSIVEGEGEFADQQSHCHVIVYDGVEYQVITETAL